MALPVKVAIRAAAVVTEEAVEEADTVDRLGNLLLLHSKAHLAIKILETLYFSLAFLLFLLTCVRFLEKSALKCNSLILPWHPSKNDNIMPFSRIFLTVAIL